MKTYLIIMTIILMALSLTAKDVKETLLHKVVYSEASPLVASDYERYLVVSVIKNRVDNKYFSNGKLDSINDVLSARNAFSSIITKNVNWCASKCPKTLNKINAFLKKKSYPDITLYHDKSISKPKQWKDVVKVCETENFIFYKINKNKNRKKA